jgi:hypothetical protein
MVIDAALHPARNCSGNLIAKTENESNVLSRCQDGILRADIENFFLESFLAVLLRSRKEDTIGWGRGEASIKPSGDPTPPRMHRACPFRPSANARA